MVSPDYHKNQGKGVEHAQRKSDFGRQQYLKATDGSYTRTCKKK